MMPDREPAAPDREPAQPDREPAQPDREPAAPDGGSGLPGFMLGLQSTAGNAAVVRMIEGASLPAETAASMGARFGADFSGVRVHTGTDADALNRSIQARAFTAGEDIFFSSGSFTPGTADGQELLAHELTHVVQQRAAGPGVAPARVSRPGEPAEVQAREVGRSVVGPPVGAAGLVPAAPSPAAVHREPAGAEAPTAPAVGSPGAPLRVVERGIETVGPGQLAARLGLPPETVPPGAEANPDFVLSLATAGSRLARLEEVRGVPKEVVESVPEGEVVEVPANHTLTTFLAVAEGTEHALHTMGDHGNETAEAVVHTRVFRSVGRLFKVIDVAYAVNRVAQASPEERPAIIGEEGGRIGGSALGSRAGVSVCLALGVGSGGIGLLACGIGGALLGDKAGEYVGGKVGTLIGNLLSIPETLQRGIEQGGQLMGDAIELVTALGSIPGQAIGAALVNSRQSVSVGNWDLRYLPPALRNDVYAVGAKVWQQLAALPPDAFLARMAQPLSTFAPPADALARIAAATGGHGPGSPAADLMALRPLEFVERMRQLHLTFVQDPAYAAGYEQRGPWLNLQPTVRERAEVNPGNWDLSKVPAIDAGDGRVIDLGQAIQSAGNAVWARIGRLDQQQLPAELAKTMKELGVDRPTAQAIADGINLLPHPGLDAMARKFNLDVGVDVVEFETILDSSPATFVALLHDWHVPLRFVREPGQIEAMAARWIRAGFQPW